jgi:hypothetical protein
VSRKLVGTSERLGAARLGARVWLLAGVGSELSSELASQVDVLINQRGPTCFDRLDDSVNALQKGEIQPRSDLEVIKADNLSQ